MSKIIFLRFYGGIPEKEFFANHISKNNVCNSFYFSILYDCFSFF